MVTLKGKIIKKFPDKAGTSPSDMWGGILHVSLQEMLSEVWSSLNYPNTPVFPFQLLESSILSQLMP